MFDVRDWLDDSDCPAGSYALALEEEGFEFLIDPALLDGPPRVLVRRAGGDAEIWLDDNDVSLTRPSRFPPDRERRTLELVRQNLEDLLSLWYHLRNDARRGRLSRNPFTD